MAFEGMRTNVPGAKKENMRKEKYQFECHMYVGVRGELTLKMPIETGPRKVVRLQSVDHDVLIQPGFRKLLATFESLPKPCA
jgi:hypothetical protein